MVPGIEGQPILEGRNVTVFVISFYVESYGEEGVAEATGNESVTVVPVPSVLVKEIVPWCASMIFFTT